MRNLLALAVGDFRDRVRRPAYFVILLAAVGLGWLATPAGEAGWVVVQVGEYRGRYNSAYTGTIVALAGAVWLSLGGFYVVRNALSRDESTGVGRLLASTPLSAPRYLASKFLSSVLVLASMLGVLVVTAMVMQLARGEVTAVDPVALLTPFVLVALPLMVFTAAAALLFEAIPVLRAGFGNVVWFFVWSVLAIGGQSPDAPLGGIGVHPVVRSLGTALEAQGIDPSRVGEFSLGLTLIDEPLKTFAWDGFAPSGGYLLTRLALVLLAVLLALLPLAWFPRFDTARGHAARGHAARAAATTRGRTTRAAATAQSAATVPPAVASGPQPPAGIFPGAVGEAVPSAVGETVPSAVGETVPSAVGEAVPAAHPAVFGGAPRSPVERRNPALRLFAGEVRILVQGVALWWWAGAVLLAVVSQLVTPATAVARVLLPMAWLWPVLIWSRLGTQRYETGVDALLGACPSAHRRILAEWGAGFLLTAVAGAGPALRMATGGDTAGLLHWFLGALFVPSLALALGSLSRTHRLFQAVYLPLWYAAVNGIAPLDFMGALRGPDGLPVGMAPGVVLGAAVVMLGVVLTTSGMRRAAR
ncbi:ABC transporter permease [Streptomyces sp. NPDC004111]|uniref:ABC transporter permease n=1 Tax=Streptomyces sp. NPDC004111 TaxID=3364690 RepID=UPI00369A7F35